MTLDATFLTRPQKERSTFEKKYLERFGNAGDKRIGLPGLSPQLVDKQREMEMANTRLEEARAKFELWKTNLQRKRKEVEEQQQALAEQKKSLDSFTQHHIMELEKAKKREHEELEKAKEIERELKGLTEREEALRERNDALTEELKELQPCADYLQSVVEACQTFDNVEAILHRHESLAHTRAEYLERYQALMTKYGSDEAELSKLLETRKSHLIDSTMKYNEAISRIARTRKQNEYRNTSLIKDVQRIEEKCTELAAIRTSIKTIYNRAIQRSSAITMHDKQQRKRIEASEEAMLEYIEHRFIDLKDIIREANPTLQSASTFEATPEKEKKSK